MWKMSDEKSAARFTLPIAAYIIHLVQPTGTPKLQTQVPSATSFFFS
jgi:hypothetical protein